ncbi:MAG: NAD(P)/FAD-dependent oxidoreductase [Ichthyobacteriaceae bacterium]|nr:NAD(P)/FAD-dependent oxidoreductase [Ichthyobacteriaceae bacterium]
MLYDVIVVGGGAGGFFTAINLAEKNPKLKICILEKSSQVLAKVKISGGGRCNFTHACYIPQELVNFYPRGKKELLGPFNVFACGDTLQWFEDNNIEFYNTDDGSFFPKSDDSQTIIDLFTQKAKTYGIDILNNFDVLKIEPNENTWSVSNENKKISTKKLVITTGSNKKVWDLLNNIGHTIVEPVPSLFTFKISDERINGLMGLVVENATVNMVGSKIDEQNGPLLITHWGMSGPSVLKLSAFGAREMYNKSYQFKVEVNYVPEYDYETMLDKLKELRDVSPKKTVFKNNPFEIPNRLWVKLVEIAEIENSKNWADVTKKQFNKLATELCKGVYNVNGRYKHKEEFVTAGGVALKEINFKRFESKVHDNLFLAGEVLDIDAVTGGFNFQNAWTGAWIISNSITEDFSKN